MARIEEENGRFLPFVPRSTARSSVLAVIYSSDSTFQTLDLYICLFIPVVVLTYFVVFFLHRPSLDWRIRSQIKNFNFWDCFARQSWTLLICFVPGFGCSLRLEPLT